MCALSSASSSAPTPHPSMTSHFLGCLCMAGGDRGNAERKKKRAPLFRSPHLGKKSRDEVGVGLAGLGMWGSCWQGVLCLWSGLRGARKGPWSPSHMLATGTGVAEPMQTSWTMRRPVPCLDDLSFLLFCSVPHLPLLGKNSLPRHPHTEQLSNPAADTQGPSH